MDGLDEIPATPPIRRAASSKASFCSRDSWSDVGEIEFGEVGLNPLSNEHSEPVREVPIWAGLVHKAATGPPEREDPDFDLDEVTISQRPRAVTEPTLLRPKPMLEDSPVNTPRKSRPSDSRLAAERTEEHVRSVAEKAITLASYAPTMLLERIKGDQRPPTVAERHDFDGAVCFVDVSGFTALSEALAKQHGPVHGAELLNNYINSYFEKLIDCVLGHGGDVIKFAGDAMQARGVTDVTNVIERGRAWVAM